MGSDGGGGTWPWNILGLDEQPTGERAVKRAYAARRKVLGKDPDPDAFQELQSAYAEAQRRMAEPLEQAHWRIDIEPAKTVVQEPEPEPEPSIHQLDDALPSLDTADLKTFATVRPDFSEGLEPPEYARLREFVLRVFHRQTRFTDDDTGELIRILHMLSLEQRADLEQVLVLDFVDLIEHHRPPTPHDDPLVTLPVTAPFLNVSETVFHWFQDQAYFQERHEWRARAILEALSVIRSAWGPALWPLPSREEEDNSGVPWLMNALVNIPLLFWIEKALENRLAVGLALAMGVILLIAGRDYYVFFSRARTRSIFVPFAWISGLLTAAYILVSGAFYLEHNFGPFFGP